MTENFNQLIKKYNKPGPRYTSYPPVPFWREKPSEELWIHHLKENSFSDGVSLYIHVPFCEKLCFYCGCNRTITKNHSIEDEFVESLLEEWNLLVQKLGKIPVIKAVHFGGGTPTFLSALNITKLMDVFLQTKSDDFVGSIEIDPRTVKDEHFVAFKKNLIKRASLGIQDFDEDVQKSINREQSFELVKSVVAKLRESEIESINFDVIYGLPKQTLESMKATIDKVINLNPDIISFFGYAHLPEKIKNQRLIKNEELPEGSEKRALYDFGHKLLIEAGFLDIGMDHFSKPDGYLALAKNNGDLHRNFMGYTEKKSPVLIGLGPSSISDSGLSFMQNNKEYKDYKKSISEKKLAYSHGHVHSEDDLMAQEIILNLMCQNKFPHELLENIPFKEKINESLKEFERDGLITFQNDQIVLKKEGQAFIRNIAMIFDHHLRLKTLDGESKIKFSQTI
jgi:oxygen-independent coproporphyrinogen-3 oxidase